ncbi:MAG: hypothetical protein C4B58_13265 [Deltaproteobacteria bacterium]|nr:MAG: hypothetical protein C4B58_13265 [Deltaproteobacteria bacterium]
MKKWYSVVVFFVFFLFSGAVNSFAELTADELLQVLIEKGIVTEDDIVKIKEGRIEEINEEWKPSPQEKEFVVKSARKPISINFKGRVQARYTHIENGGDLGEVTHQNAFDDSEFDGFSLRRVRLRWYGDVYDRWQYHVQLSVDGDHNPDKLDPATPDYELKKQDIGVKLQDAYFVYKAHPFVNVRVGQFKARFSPSYTTAGPKLPLCERPLVIDKLARKREIGISLESPRNGQWDGRTHGAKINDSQFFYAIGLYNGNSFNHMRNDNENFMISGMLLWRPSPHFILGTSYAYDQMGYDYETTLLGKAIEVGDHYEYPIAHHKVANNLQLWDFNCAFDWKPVHLQFEYITQDGDESRRQYGYGIQTQIDLTDNFQLTARYDEFDPNVDVDNSLDSRWYTVGYNWFIHGQNIKWQLNYSFREEMHGKDIDNDILVTHFQVLF